MTPVNITVKSVKKNEIPSNGSTTVQSAAFLLIVTVFLGKIQMSTPIMATSWEVPHSNLTFTHTQCTFIEEIKTNDNIKSDLSMCLL